MQLEIVHANDTSIAILEADGVAIKEEQDVLDFMAEAGQLGARRMVFRNENLPDEFFDLHTGFAGEILQKFSTYRVQLALVGDLSARPSQALQAFIRESNRTGHVYFVPSLEEAKERLAMAPTTEPLS